MISQTYEYPSPHTYFPEETKMGDPIRFRISSVCLVLSIHLGLFFPHLLHFFPFVLVSAGNQIICSDCLIPFGKRCGEGARGRTRDQRERNLEGNKTQTLPQGQGLCRGKTNLTQAKSTTKGREEANGTKVSGRGCMRNGSRLRESWRSGGNDRESSETFRNIDQGRDERYESINEEESLTEKRSALILCFFNSRRN